MVVSRVDLQNENCILLMAISFIILYSWLKNSIFFFSLKKTKSIFSYQEIELKNNSHVIGLIHILSNDYA